MQKETIIAILFGLSLGLMVTAGAYYLRSKNQAAKITKTEKTIAETTVTPTAKEKGKLEIKTPLDGLITSKETLDLTGKYKPEAYLVKVLNNNIDLLRLDQESFSFKLNLKDELNMIYVIGVDLDGQTESQARLVVKASQTTFPPEATTAAKTDLAQNTEIKSATKEAILNRINKKLGKDVGRKRALLGKVEKVTAESITLSNDQGEFILALNQAILLKEDKPIKVSQVEVGNWALVRATLDSTETTPDLITPEVKLTPEVISFYSKKPIPSAPAVYLGTITKLNKKELTLTTRNNNEHKTFSLLNKNLVIDDLNGNKATQKDLDTDLNVLVISYQDKDKLTASHIRLLTEVEKK